MGASRIFWSFREWNDECKHKLNIYICIYVGVYIYVQIIKLHIVDIDWIYPPPGNSGK